MYSPDYFMADVNDYTDSGLGFMQGSTDGVYNQYYAGNCNKKRLPESTKLQRREFNLTKCNSAYRCHYDPYPLDNDGDINELIEYRQQQQPPSSSQLMCDDSSSIIASCGGYFSKLYNMLDKMDLQNKTVFAVIVTILILFVLIVLFGTRTN